MGDKSFIEVQFPIGPLSLESYNERRVSHGKVLSLGKWWGEKPLVLTRAIILGAVFPSSNDPERWSDDLEIFLKCLCFDNVGMWKRKIKPLPATICLGQATEEERRDFFNEDGGWLRATKANAQAAAERAGEVIEASEVTAWWLARRTAMEKRIFYTLTHAEQRDYCCRVEEIDGPPEESWEEINAYLSVKARSLGELIQQLAQRKFGCGRLKVGDAFCGAGFIPFEAGELGCDVFASDLNPAASLLTWGALNIVGGEQSFRDKLEQAQESVYSEIDAWIIQKGYEFSEESWRADLFLY